MEKKRRTNKLTPDRWDMMMTTMTMVVMMVMLTIDIIFVDFFCSSHQYMLQLLHRKRYAFLYAVVILYVVSPYSEFSL